MWEGDQELSEKKGQTGCPGGSGLCTIGKGRCIHWDRNKRQPKQNKTQEDAEVNMPLFHSRLVEKVHRSKNMKTLVLVLALSCVILYTLW